MKIMFILRKTNWINNVYFENIISASTHWSYRKLAGKPTNKYDPITGRRLHQTKQRHYNLPVSSRQLVDLIEKRKIIF